MNHTYHHTCGAQKGAQNRIEVNLINIELNSQEFSCNKNPNLSNYLRKKVINVFGTCSRNSFSCTESACTCLVVLSSFSCKIFMSFCSDSPSASTAKDKVLIRGNHSKFRCYEKIFRVHYYTVYACNLCSDFVCDLLFLTDVNDWIDNECPQWMIPHLNIPNWFTSIKRRKDNIAKNDGHN